MEELLFEGNKVSTDRILYTPSAFAKTSLLFLQEVGTLQALHQHTSSRKNLNSYLFFIVISGAGTLDYQRDTYELHAGDCVFIDCRKPYAHYTSSTALWKLQWVHFYGSGMHSIYEKYVERGGKPVFHPADTHDYAAKIDEIYQVADSLEYVRDMHINEKLSGLLTLLMAESWDPEVSGKTTGKRRDLQNVLEYLDNNYLESIRLDELADLFYINKYYLTRIFKEQFGCSITAYLQEKRITRAKQLLRFTSDSIDVISEKCGISDENYFARLFKKIEGVTPGEYRKMW